MKKYLYLLTLVCSVTILSCKSPAQKKAENIAKQIKSVTQANMPPMVNTSKDGYFMKAMINGKPWTASSMMEFNDMNTERVYASDGETKIGFYLDLKYLHTGTERNFADDFVADLLTNDEVGAWGGRKGKIVITKDDGKVIEGTFYFTATTHSDPNKKMEVKDGFFRIIIKKS